MARASELTATAAEDGAALVPLIVDVDGTLLRTDLLLESAFHFIRQQPWRAWDLVRWLRRGKAVLKAELADRIDLAVDALPYNESVLATIEEARREGRPIYLASASNHRYVAAIAAHLGLFDGIFASDATANLAGPHKARALVDSFGEGGFDYIGDSAVDVAVWRRARRAITIDAGRRALERIRADLVDVLVLPDVPRLRGTRLEALRPHQWSKNLLVFLPLLAAQEFTLAAAVAATLAFVAFSMAASSAYIVNDLLDLQDDRRHPTKRHRPFAAGVVPLRTGLVTLPLLLVLAMIAAGAVSWALFVIVAGYFATTLLYSLLLKHKPLIDVLTLALLYTIRAVGGAVAISVLVSPWLLAFCLSVFLCLAIVKRLTEIRKLGHLASTTRIRGYVGDDVVILAALSAAAGFSSVLVLALYINSEAVRLLYTMPDLLWGVCVCLLYWVSRILLLANRGLIDDDPIVWAMTNRVSLATIALAGVVVLAAARV